ncbi:uncharacterized protein L3040_000935 [Drepanopeziza brunnea f. sp. 'multigermtubi']|uniref:uncharacterized protein n=1 Tax=Drepanopeziza brunnea f. sp. 'multigermtubi' TaxID=698441 RepID=UPI0023A5BAA9|nr:hypothetical protein L3040_000935 [Drepanopeziza brunnea f. sp. 'multigermtubi']
MFEQHSQEQVDKVSFRSHLLRQRYFNFAVDTIQFFSCAAFFTFSLHQDPAGEKSRVLAVMVPKNPGPRTQFTAEPTTGLQQDTVQGLVAAAGEDPNEEINKTYAYRLLATERDAGNTITTLSDNTIANLFPKSFRLGLMDDCAMFQAARTGEFNFSREDGGPRGRDHDAL